MTTDHREREAIERAKAWSPLSLTDREVAMYEALDTSLLATRGFACGYLAASDAAWNEAILAILNEGDEGYSVAQRMLSSPVGEHVAGALFGIALDSGADLDDRANAIECLSAARVPAFDGLVRLMLDRCVEDANESVRFAAAAGESDLPIALRRAEGTK